MSRALLLIILSVLPFCAQAGTFVNPLTRSVLKAIADSTNGQLLSESPQLAEFRVDRIPIILGADDAHSDEFLLNSFPTLSGVKHEHDPKEFGLQHWKSAAALSRQQPGDFGFYSKSNAPFGLEDAFKNPAFTAILIQPELNPSSKGSSLERAFVFRNYIHEAFHLAQVQKQQSISEAEGRRLESIANPENFCAAVGSDPSLFALLYKQMNEIRNLVSMIGPNASRAELQKQITRVGSFMAELKTKSQASYDFVRFWQFEEGSAEFIGTKAAMKYSSLSFDQAIKYQLGYSLENNVMTGNDVTYRSAALAGLIAEALELKVNWDRHLYLPSQTWWEMIAATPLPADLKIEKLLPIDVGPYPKTEQSEQSWLMTRYCNLGQR